ncbi:MAG: hypothetical protein GTO14_19750 [Anaerolineales bacterium]|nr:hypothetical protein [Anaerolineales bacterium]
MSTWFRENPSRDGKGKGAMSEEDVMTVNPNLADIEMITRLPGVGEALARRILEGRPYGEEADLLRVSGIGKATLARLSPHLTFGEEPVLVDEIEEQPVTEAMVEPESDTLEEKLDEQAVIPEEMSEPELKVRPTRVAARRRSARSSLIDIREPVWFVLGTTVIAVVLSILFTLAILGGINRTLDVGEHQAVRQLESDIVDLRVEVQDMNSRMEALGRRMEAVEGLSGRVQIVEDEFGALQDRVSKSLDEMAAVRVLVQDLETEVERLSQAYGRFDAFLEGLRQLLGTLTTGIQPETPTQP